MKYYAVLSAVGLLALAVGLLHGGTADTTPSTPSIPATPSTPLTTAITSITSATAPATAPSTPSTPRDVYRLSLQWETRGCYTEACDVLQAVPRGYRRDMRLGHLNYQAGRYPAASAHYRAAIDDAPDSLEARVAYLLPLLAENRLVAAETVARQITRVDPNNYFANLRLAYSLRLQLKFDQAEEVAGRMAHLLPSDIALLTEQALARVGQNNKEGAKALFNEILLLDPDNALALAQLAVL